MKALNEAQFEMEHYQSLLLQSQQTWAERFDRFNFVSVLLCPFGKKQKVKEKSVLFGLFYLLHTVWNF